MYLAKSKYFTVKFDIALPQLDNRDDLNYDCSIYCNLDLYI